ncbi:hypothetical protein ACIQCD_31130 [Streptomyces sp. NPDC093250]|uniref:hypothetical protein n=1 Tax=unclassified Streptomyces TaxID=2593676 RepID=UPI003414AD5E
MLRFLEIRRTREPVPSDFDHDFGALIARTLSDLTPDERHVLRSVSLLDAFDLTLATAASGLPHQAPVQRLIERPFVRENVFGLWPYHLHGLIRSTIRSADDATDDRWTDGDWRQAAERALAALGTQWTGASTTGQGRMLLIGCLRQGLTLARDFGLELGWLADAAWAYVSDSVWEPIAPPSRPGSDGLETSADALVELLAALARRQHEHRSATASRLAAVTGSHLLPADLHEMGVYYLAKAHRHLGDSAASRHGMQLVADGGGRLAPAARRGLAHLARLAGDFPAAYDTARTLGWDGRQHRVEGGHPVASRRHGPRGRRLRRRPRPGRAARRRRGMRHQPSPARPRGGLHRPHRRGRRAPPRRATPHRPGSAGHQPHRADRRARSRRRHPARPRNRPRPARRDP